MAQSTTFANRSTASKTWHLARFTRKSRFSPRIAPATIGMGLLEAIPEAHLLTLADPDDANGDGISGRPNYVWDLRRGELVLGRFGWKANQPTVEQQAAGAFLGDIGVTSSLFTDENCPPSQEECGQAPNGGHPEMPDSRFREGDPIHSKRWQCPPCVTLKIRRYNKEPECFVQSQCSMCHTPSPRNRRYPPASTPPEPGDLSLHRPPAARHGRRPRGQSTRWAGVRYRVAYCPPLGHRSRGDGERPHNVPPRWPRPQHRGSHPLAWRRSRRSSARLFWD